MNVFGKDSFYICGVKAILQEIAKQRRSHSPPLDRCIYVTTGMDLAEMFSCMTQHPPHNYAIFISPERYFYILKRLYPDLTILCLPEQLTVSELRQALTVMETLQVQNAAVNNAQNLFKFTQAEQQIMRLTLRGYSIDEIASIRSVSPSTVSVQRSGLMKRTGTKSIQELCVLYSSGALNMAT
ncbi:helix-turn-helix transcriptional regulator [Mixta intestinalis]|jgi:DNA-binding CsgD family transcriptional regulator|uniref:HTH luxR-type domain-containing protein n=1 Tax=Mixta intestinalis TaxID=1615494 RepID=A0A6P1PV42_9GAMM|nr:LuxR C-terminal-related transcriptional regulator [Mixta intestinalis]QHM70001.1 hypothetical protein C7M51_00261 [Mixta intestinalis]